MSTTIRVEVNDDTLHVLLGPEDHPQNAEATAARILQEAIRQKLLPGQRMIVLGPKEIDALESLVSGGSVLNGMDLVAKVGRLAGISFHHTRIQFTPGQLEDVARRAASNGLTVDQLLERTTPRIYEMFFNLLA